MEQKENKKKKIILISIGFILLIAVAVGICILVNTNPKKDKTGGNKLENTEVVRADNQAETTEENASKEDTSTVDGTEEAAVTSGGSTGQGSGNPKTDSDEKTEEESGNSGKKPEESTSGGSPTTEKPTATENPSTTEQPTTTESGSGGGGESHQHDWQPQYKTVHHEEKGHNEKVCVQEAYDEPVYESYYVCGYCGKKLGDEQLSHCITCGPPYPEDHPLHDVYPTQGSSYHTEKVQVDTIHHEAVYETQWVVDEKAYDEQVLTGYKCSCGATKSK